MSDGFGDPNVFLRSLSDKRAFAVPTMIGWGDGGAACQRALSLSPPLPGEKKRIREVGGKQQLDLLLPLKSVKVCGAAVLHHQHKVPRHRQQ